MEVGAIVGLGVAKLRTLFGIRAVVLLEVRVAAKLVHPVAHVRLAPRRRQLISNLVQIGDPGGPGLIDHAAGGRLGCRQLALAQIRGRGQIGIHRAGIRVNRLRLDQLGGKAGGDARGWPVRQVRKQGRRSRRAGLRRSRRCGRGNHRWRDRRGDDCGRGCHRIKGLRRFGHQRGIFKGTSRHGWNSR